MFTKCKRCGQKHLSETTKVVTKHFGKVTKQLHFCSEVCANEYYLEKLRSVEGKV